MKEKIKSLFEQGLTPEEIAEKLGEETCVTEFRDCPSWCHEDADCHDCWVKCVEEVFEFECPICGDKANVIQKEVEGQPHFHCDQCDYRFI